MIRGESVWRFKRRIIREFFQVGSDLEALSVTDKDYKKRGEEENMATTQNWQKEKRKVLKNINIISYDLMEDGTMQPRMTADVIEETTENPAKILDESATVLNEYNYNEELQEEVLTEDNDSSEEIDPNEPTEETSDEEEKPTKQPSRKSRKK